MNWEAIGAIGEVVGSFGVIATLIYLAVQIRQNTTATRYETTQHLVLAQSNADGLIASDPDLAAIIQKGCFDRKVLTEEEQFRFNAFFHSTYNHFDFAYHQYLGGQLDEAIWRKMARTMPLYIGTLPGCREWWEQDKMRFTSEYVAYMEELMVSAECAAKIPTLAND